MIYSETVFPLFITEDVECNNLEKSIRNKTLFHYNKDAKQNSRSLFEISC